MVIVNTECTGRGGVTVNTKVTGTGMGMAKAMGTHRWG